MLPASAWECGGKLEHTCILATVYAISRIGRATTTTNPIAQYVIVTLINEKTRQAVYIDQTTSERANTRSLISYQCKEKAHDDEYLPWYNRYQIPRDNVAYHTLPAFRKSS